MSSNSDIKTKGYVLRRTNYGEADRILNLITEVGKISVIAKGARKERSKLAGGIEMFTLSTYNIHKGKNELGVLTGVKAEMFLGNILKDYRKMEFSVSLLKKINKVSEDSDNRVFFDIINQCLINIDSGMDLGLVEAWFNINIAKALGEELNVYRDVDGELLKVGCRYRWVVHDAAFLMDEKGEYGEDEIKLLRLMSKMSLTMVRKIKLNESIIMRVVNIAKMIEK